MTQNIKQLVNQAHVHINNGNLLEAKNLYNQICQIDTENAEAWMMLGAINGELGNLPDAESFLRQAIKLQPNYREAHYNLGSILARAGKQHEAIDCFQKVTQIAPEFSGGWYMLGQIHGQSGKLDEAESYFRKTITLQPGQAEAHLMLGNIQRAQRKFDQAMISYRQALALNPSSAEGHYYLGTVLTSQGKLEEAISSLQKAVTFNPGLVTAYNELGGALQALGRQMEAISAYQKAISIKPDDARIYSNLSNAYKFLGQLDEAENSLRQALQLDPNFSEAFNNLGNILKLQGRNQEAVNNYRRAVELKPNYVEAHSNLLLCLNYLTEYSPAGLLEEHKAWGHAHVIKFSGKQVINTPDPDRRIRIGYVSPDFRVHPVAYFIEAILKNHNADQFEIICYAEVTRQDGTTERLRKLVHSWRNTCSLNDKQLINTIKLDGVDILVDLAGHTGGNRLPIFSDKAAPIQVSYIGYPNTTGLSSVDYRLTDVVSDPPGSEKYYTEKLIYLKNGFTCYSPPADVPEVNPLPAREKGFVTYGSFNNLSKINTSVIDLWCQILRANPSSRLLVYRHMLRGSVRERYYHLFNERGIDRDRVDLMHKIPDEYQDLPYGKRYYGLYGHIDIALDTFPWNGHTITCETLWMGIPVVTLYGDRHAGRICSSVLKSIGLPQLIATTPDQYVKIAVELASNYDGMEKLRAGLREQMKNSPLCDGGAFTKELEDVYREIWGKWCSDVQGETH